MKHIRISHATHSAVADLVILPFQSTATKLPDGSWAMPVSDEVWARLQDLRLTGENDDDLISGSSATITANA
jgi:hypothetical protein